ncbi:hypothetical protein ABPG72_015515 [Tetrahymena utriculariae]
MLYSGETNAITNHQSQTDQEYIGIQRGLFEDSAMKGLKGDDDHISISQHNQITDYEAGKMGSAENMHMFIESDINATYYQEFNNQIDGKQKQNISQHLNNSNNKIVLLCNNTNNKEMEQKNNFNNDELNTSLCIQKSYIKQLSQQNTKNEFQQGKKPKLKTMGTTLIPNIPLKQQNGLNNANKFQSDFDLTCQKIDSIKDASKESNDNKYDSSEQITQNYIGRKSVLNYQKAANIVNNVISKSLNRVQRIDKHVKYFVQTLIQKMKNRPLPNLLEAQIKLLNDVSYYHQSRANKKLIHQFLIRLQDFANLKNPLPVFMPTNDFRVYWDIFQTIFTYSFLYIYSILIFFAFKEKDSEFIQQFFQYTFIVFLLDVLINFNTAYFNKDIIIANRRQIIWRYLSSHVFLTDAICLFIMGSKVIMQSTDLVYNPDSKLFPFFINTLVFLKLNGINPKRERFGYVFTLRESQKHIIRLFNQLLSVVAVAHTVSLAWYTLGVYEHQNGYAISWLDKYQFTDLSYLEQYIYSMYWSITTMTTAQFKGKQINISLFFYDKPVTTFIYPFVFKSNERYLNRKNVNIQLQSRVRHYLSFLAEEQKDRDQLAENQIFSILSNKLRNEIVIEINSRILKNYSIFSANFSTQTLRKLVFIMEEVLISPNEIIFEEGDNEGQSVYLIESGNIEIYQVSPQSQSGSNLNQNKTHILQSLNKGSIFGEISFFSGLARKASARSTNLSTLYKINRNQFIELIKENSEDFERFKMMEEQVKFQQDLSILFIECYTCKSLGHIVSQCPIIHQIFDKQFKVLKNNFSIFQNRSVHLQRKTKSYKFNPVYNASCNLQICQTLKEQIRGFNSYTEIIFKSDIDISQQSSEEENEENSENEYNSTSSDSSLSSNQDQNSMFQQQNEKQVIKKEKSNSQQYEPNKSQKSLKNYKSLKNLKRKSKQKNRKSKKDESLKQLNNLKDVENQLILRDLSPKQKTSNEDFLTNDKFSDYSKRESIDKSDKRYEDLKDFLHQNQQSQEQNDYLQDPNSNINKSQNSRNQNNSHLTIPSQKDVIPQSSQLDNVNENPKKKCTQQISFIYEKSISNEESNSNSFIEDQALKQVQISPQKSSSKQRKATLKPQKTQRDIRPSIDVLVQNTIYNAFIAQSAALTNTQNELNRLESTISKLEERFSVFNTQNSKSMKSIDSNLLTRRISQQQNPSTLFQKQTNEFRQSQLGINNLNNKKLSVYKDSQENKISKMSIDVQGLPSQQELRQETVQNIMLEKIYKMLDKSNIKDVSVRASQQLDEYSQLYQSATQNVLNKLDMIKNFKKFFPHNNFTYILNKLNSKKLLFKSKKSRTQFNIQKTRRQNIIVQLKTARKSLFCNAIIQKPTPSQLDYNSYKPTFLSYGVSQKSETIYPKFLMREAFYI